MRKGVILIVTIVLTMIILIWALAVLYFMTQESRIAGHKMRRIRALFAAKAGMIQTFEKVRKGEIPEIPDGNPYTKTISVGNPADKGYPIRVEIEVDDTTTGTFTILDGTRQIRATAHY